MSTGELEPACTNGSGVDLFAVLSARWCEITDRHGAVVDDTAKLAKCGDFQHVAQHAAQAAAGYGVGVHHLHRVALCTFLRAGHKERRIGRDADSNVAAPAVFQWHVVAELLTFFRPRRKKDLAGQGHEVVGRGELRHAMSLAVVF